MRIWIDKGKLLETREVEDRNGIERVFLVEFDLFELDGRPVTSGTYRGEGTVSRGPDGRLYAILGDPQTQAHLPEYVVADNVNADSWQRYEGFKAALRGKRKLSSTELYRRSEHWIDGYRTGLAELEMSPNESMQDNPRAPERDLLVRVLSQNMDYVDGAIPEQMGGTSSDLGSELGVSTATVTRAAKWLADHDIFVDTGWAARREGKFGRQYTEREKTAGGMTSKPGASTVWGVRQAVYERMRAGESAEQIVDEALQMHPNAKTRARWIPYDEPHKWQSDLGGRGHSKATWSWVRSRFASSNAYPTIEIVVWDQSGQQRTRELGKHWRTFDPREAKEYARELIDSGQAKTVKIRGYLNNYHTGVRESEHLVWTFGQMELVLPSGLTDDQEQALAVAADYSGTKGYGHEPALRTLAKLGLVTEQQDGAEPRWHATEAGKERARALGFVRNAADQRFAKRAHRSVEDLRRGERGWLPEPSLGEVLDELRASGASGVEQAKHFIVSTIHAERGLAREAEIARLIEHYNLDYGEQISADDYEQAVEELLAAREIERTQGEFHGARVAAFKRPGVPTGHAANARVPGARWLADKYGLTGSEANELATHPRQGEIIRHVEDWRDRHGAAASSPIARGELLRALRETPRTRQVPSWLAHIKVLYRGDDWMPLWGIPYELRPGQQPRDIGERFRSDWILLEPFSALQRSDQQKSEIEAFLGPLDAAGLVPDGPHEWARIADYEAMQPNQDQDQGCRCGNCPPHRMARGLPPFCRMPPPAPRPQSGYDTYAEADRARRPGQAVVGVRGGMGHGPMRYILRGKPREDQKPNARTWTDERGYERGKCACGSEPSTHPDDAYGGLAFCGDCNIPTCAECRIDDAATRCLRCAEQEGSLEPNESGYWVWLLAQGKNEPLTSEGPYGPYPDLDGAKTFARIGATEGEHDRAVSQGRSPSAATFQIVRRYERGTGRRLL